jgi:hypothetical protein
MAIVLRHIHLSRGQSVPATGRLAANGGIENDRDPCLERSLGSVGLLGRPSEAAGLYLMGMGRLDEAQEAFERVLARAEAEGVEYVPAEALLRLSLIAAPGATLAAAPNWHAPAWRPPSSSASASSPACCCSTAGLPRSTVASPAQSAIMHGSALSPPAALAAWHTCFAIKPCSARVTWRWGTMPPPPRCGRSPASFRPSAAAPPTRT